MILTAKQQLLLNQVKTLHDGQLRKYTNEPYWTHPLAVAEMVFKESEYYQDDKSFATEIALLHDVLEDQYDRCDEIEMLNVLGVCGYPIYDAMHIVMHVIELTDVYTHKNFPQANRKFRKMCEAGRLAKVTKLSQSIKYADLLHNTESIMEHDMNFAKVYIYEKKTLIAEMKDGNEKLRAMCFDSINKCLTKLEKYK